MANDELYVLNEGVRHSSYADVPSAFNTNTSINPRLVTRNSTSGASYLNCYEIHDTNVIGSGDMAANMALGNILNRYHPSGSTVESYGVNLIENPGHRITVDVSLTTSQLEEHDYFVVINADNAKMHHVGKITDVSTYEGTKTNIDFTPALKENIAYGVKISIYQGPDIKDSGKNVDTVVAVGYGLLGSNSIDRNGNFVEVSSPTFYFYRDLEPDRKYVAFKQTNIISLKQSVFKTAPVTSNFIIDKSFYSQNATLVDNNKIGDESSPPVNFTQYDGTTGNYTLDVTGWATSSKNYDFAMGSSTTTFPTYIRPITSPNKNQYMGHIMGANLNRSITDKGNMAEVKFIDPERMLERKINDYENFNVKELIDNEKFTYKPNAILPGTYNGTGSTITVTNLEEGVDLKDLLGSSSPFELIYIGDYYYKLSAISGPSGGTQTLTVSDRRLFSAFKFEGSSTVDTMVNQIAYRNIWSSKVENLIVTHDIDTIIDSGVLKRSNITLENSESDINDIEYIIASDGLLLKVKRGNKLGSYVELEDNKSSNYMTNHSILDSISGELIVNKKIFKGKAELIETDTEGGIFNLTISGRDEISTLLDYPINKNFLYSREWVASTISPVTDTFTDTGLDITTNSSTEQLGTSSVICTGTLSAALTYGDVLYVLYNGKYTPLGVVSQDIGTGTKTSISLLNDLLIDPHTDFNGSDTLDNNNIYVGKNKLLAGRSLHNHYRTTPHVSLYGAADKGMVFYGTGNILTKTGSSASDGASIISLNTPDEDADSIFNTKDYGIDITGIAALEGSSDSPKDSPYGLDFDNRLIGSLSHMHLIGTPISVDDNILNVEIGHISPIVMARMDRNDNTRNGSISVDSFYTNSIGMYFLNKQGIDRGGFIHLLDNNNDSENKGSTWRRIITESRKFHTSGSTSPDLTISNNYSFRFGSPIFRYNNLSDTSLKYWRNVQDHNRNLVRKTQPNLFYFNKPAQFSAYASALRAMGNEAIDKDYHRDQTSAHLKELPIEQSWQYPVSGSGHIDFRIMDDFTKNSRHDYYRFIADSSNVPTFLVPDKNFMEMDDPMCNSYFLFAPGDMLPESQKRPDHIFFNGSDSVTRNTSDYFLLVKYIDSVSNTSINHEIYQGTTKFTVPSDNNYDLLPISSNLSTNPKRFNLLRLKPMTLDSYMNEADYETYPIGSSFDAGQTGVIPANPRINLAKNVPDMGYSVYEVSTTSATSSSSANIQVTTTVPFFDVGSPNTLTRLTFDNSSYGGNASTTNSFNASGELLLFTNPSQDTGSDTPRFLGKVTSSSLATSDIDTLVLSGNCNIDGYSGKIFVVEGDVTLGNQGASDVIPKNNGVANFPSKESATASNNHNIHRTSRLDDQAGSFIFFNYSQKVFTRNDARPFRQKGNIKIVDSDNASATKTCKIEFEPLTYNSGASNVVVDLSNFAVGNHITLSGTSESIMNGETYEITAINATSASPRQITVKRHTNTSDNMANTSSYEDNAIIENISNTVSNVNYHPSKFIDLLTRTGSSTSENVGAFGRMSIVVVNASSSSVANNPAGSDERVRVRERREIFKEDIYTNLGQEFGVNAEAGTNMADKITGDTNGKIYDVIKINTVSAFCNASDVSEDDLELLFIPVVDIDAGNVETYQGVRASKYTDEGYIRIQTSINPGGSNSSIWNQNGYIEWIDFCPNLTGKVLIKPNGTIIRILNHTLAKGENFAEAFEGVNVHYLHVDNYSAIDSSPMHVYNFASTTTQEDKLSYPLYSLSQTNIINPKTGKFFTNHLNQYDWGGWSTTNSQFSQFSSTGAEHDGMLKGMFVVAELDGAGSAKLIHPDDTSLFASVGTSNKFEIGLERAIYMTDGIESAKLEMLPRQDKIHGSTTDKVILDFPSMKKFKGSVSIGETFNLTVQGKIKGDVEYVKIVTPFNIAPEVEQAVDQIMSENNIPYTVSNSTNRYYAGNNFTGQNSYIASNILLENKDLKLNVNGNNIKVVSNEEDKDFRPIEISEENTNIQVVQIKKDKSLLDNFNEVVVHGDGHKGIARNYSDIKRRGKTRTKEIFDYSIITQKEVDSKAIKILKLFTDAQEAIELKIAQDLPFLEPGNIITVFYPSEGIVRDNYTVIEIEKTLGMPTKLLLGQYNKELSNTLAGLLSVTKDLQGNTKRKTYASVFIPNVSVQTAKFKFIQAKVTSNTGTPAIGFTYTIGFDAGIEP